MIEFHVYSMLASVNGACANLSCDPLGCSGGAARRFVSGKSYRSACKRRFVDERKS